MKRKVSIFMALAVLYLVADLSINGLTCYKSDVHYFNYTTQMANVPDGVHIGQYLYDPATIPGMVLIYLLGIMYILGVFGPKAKEELGNDTETETH
jgi:hypothetical protein